MQVAFRTAEDLSSAVDAVFREIPVLLYHKLDAVAPYPGFQSHNGIEMYYVESGQGLYLVGDETYILEPGTLMIIRPFTLHKVLQTDANFNICRSVLMWKEEFLLEGWPSQEPFPLAHMPADCCRVAFEPGQRSRISGILSHINAEWTERQPGYLPVIRCLIQELLLLAYRRHQLAEQELTLPPAAQLPQEISYLVQFISGHFQSELTLEELSKLVHMNPSYLSSLFHKHVGLTITRFIAVKRIHYAKKLLRETEMPIADIAYQSGFNHPTYFTKTFKKQEPMTPAAYRKAHGSVGRG
ncbi:AraC family transcriptional regulator [Paenibacillus oryzisoli]|uniref:AraC family transcriptional regulator n=1 Tax=Paenibacillus oryzisoli TaxID=1850517 RepID=UPI003D288758